VKSIFGVIAVPIRRTVTTGVPAGAIMTLETRNARSTAAEVGTVATDAAVGRICAQVGPVLIGRGSIGGVAATRPVVALVTAHA